MMRSVLSGLRLYMASLVFWTALLLSGMSLWLLPTQSLATWLLGLGSVLFNLWSLYQSDRNGFVKTRHAPRSHEPLRHFSPGQVLLIFALVIAQFGYGLYLLTMH